MTGPSKPATPFRIQIDAERTTADKDGGQHVDEVAGVGSFHAEMLDDGVMCLDLAGRRFTVWAKKGKLYFRYDWTDDAAPVIESPAPSSSPVRPTPEPTMADPNVTSGSFFSSTSLFSGSLTLTSEPLPWRWSIAPGCYFTVRHAPNRFHRFMQRVFLGLIWEKNPP